MRVVVVSKRKMKKALSRNVERHGMSSYLLMCIAGQCGESLKGPSAYGSHNVMIKAMGCSWWIPKHFIGKVIK